MVEAKPNRHMPDIRTPDLNPGELLTGTAEERARIHAEDLRQALGDAVRIVPIRKGFQAIIDNKIQAGEQTQTDLSLGQPEITSATPAPSDDEISGLSDNEWSIRHNQSGKMVNLHKKVFPSPPKINTPQELDPKAIENAKIDQAHIRELQEVANSTGISTTYTCHDGTPIKIRPEARNEDPLT